MQLGTTRNPANPRDHVVTCMTHHWSHAAGRGPGKRCRSRSARDDGDALVLNEACGIALVPVHDAPRCGGQLLRIAAGSESLHAAHDRPVPGAAADVAGKAVLHRGDISVPSRACGLSHPWVISDSETVDNAAAVLFADPTK